MKGGELEGVVEEELPRGLYKVRCDDGRSFVAGLPVANRHGIVKILRGDRVLIEVSKADGARARITARLSV
jgi:translation initiation factor IF-1